MLDKRYFHLNCEVWMQIVMLLFWVIKVYHYKVRQRMSTRVLTRIFKCTSAVLDRPSNGSNIRVGKKHVKTLNPFPFHMQQTPTFIS